MVYFLLGLILLSFNMERIKVQVGTIVMNKTAKFIKPALRLYGDEFIKKLSSIYKLAYGIGDMFVNKDYEQHIFILIDTKKCINHWVNTLDWIREQNYYEDDYAFDDLVTGRLHMLVLKLPDGIDLELFMKGKYSQMYTNQEIINLLDDDTKAIVIKDSNYRVKFYNKLIEHFKITFSINDLNPDIELELPPTIDEQQIF